ncbi:MAG: hypothetical protein K0Q71_6035 [Thermomicrobiales bacterium]|jgi:hypothetical protein|nr:hypothetical protein [Thermomicrobiales bacterium]
MTRIGLRKMAVVVAFAAPLALASLASPLGADARRGCETTFSRGETTTTCTKGSHGTTDSHKGSAGSNGKDLGGGPCKDTGSTKTNTC